MMSTDSRTVEVQGVPVTLTEAGDPAARLALVLHRGAGPVSVAPLVAHLAANHRVLAPTHPGWDGTPRPGSLTGVGALAGIYLELAYANAFGQTRFELIPAEAAEAAASQDRFWEMRHALRQPAGAGGRGSDTLRRAARARYGEVRAGAGRA